MGYESALHVIGARVAPAQRQRVQRLLAGQPASQHPGLALLLGQLGFSSSGTLELRPIDLPTDEEADEEGFVCSVWGKFPAAEQFARWLGRHCEQGRVILHSREGDGAAWGWEFQRGRIRYLELKPAGTWERLRP